MIISKQNLQVVDVTRADSKIPVLDCVNILPDGTTVGGNGMSFIAVSPVPSVIVEKAAKVYGNNKCARVNVSSATVREVLKNIPSDKKYGGMLEHAEIESVDGHKVRFTLYDGSRKRNIDGRVNPNTYPPFENVFASSLQKKKNIAVDVNVKRFIMLLETMVKCSNSSGDLSRMVVEFADNNDVIVKMKNQSTDQQCIGVMLSNKTANVERSAVSQWEKEITDGTILYKHSDPSSENGHPARNGRVSGNSMLHGSGDRTHDSGNRACSTGAKRTGNKRLAFMTKDKCPVCGAYHLASDGKFRWCSCVSGCNFFERINKCQ